MSETTRLPFDPIPVGGTATLPPDPPRPTFSRSVPPDPLPTGGLLPPTRRPLPAPPSGPPPAGIAPEPVDLAPPAPASDPNPIPGTPPPNPAAVGGFLKDLFRPTRGKTVVAGLLSLVAGGYGLNVVMPLPQPAAEKQTAGQGDDPKPTGPTAAELLAKGPPPTIIPERTSPRVSAERTDGGGPGTSGGVIQARGDSPVPGPAALPPLPKPAGIPEPTPLPALPATDTPTAFPLPKPAGIPEATPLPKPAGLSDAPPSPPSMPLSKTNPPASPVKGEPSFVDLDAPKPTLKPLPPADDPKTFRTVSTPETGLRDASTGGGASTKTAAVVPLVKADTVPTPGGVPAPSGLPTPAGLPPLPNLTFDEKKEDVKVAPLPGGTPVVAKPAAFLDEKPALPAAKPAGIPAPPVPATPPGFGPAPTPVPVPAVDAAPKTDYDVDVVRVRAGDTYAAVSDRVYGTKQYAAALRAFNQGADLTQVREVMAPPMHVIRKQPAARDADPADDRRGVVPAAGVRGPVLDAPVQPDGAESVDWGAPGKRRAGVRFEKYTTPKDGMTARDVARAVYADEAEWGKLTGPRGARLRADDPLPRGTEITVPRDELPWK